MILLTLYTLQPLKGGFSKLAPGLLESSKAATTTTREAKAPHKRCIYAANTYAKGGKPLLCSSAEASEMLQNRNRAQTNANC